MACQIPAICISILTMLSLISKRLVAKYDLRPDIKISTHQYLDLQKLCSNILNAHLKYTFKNHLVFWVRGGPGVWLTRLPSNVDLWYWAQVELHNASPLESKSLFDRFFKVCTAVSYWRRVCLNEILFRLDEIQITWSVQTILQRFTWTLPFRLLYVRNN